MLPRNLQKQPGYPDPQPDFSGPHIATIHGLLARELMEKHLAKFLIASGYQDTVVYGHVYPARRIADDLAEAANAGRPIVVVSFSQGGFQAVEVARELARSQDIEVPLLATIAAGGMGRLVPTRWGSDPRRVPANVQRCLNVYSEGDALGADSSQRKTEPGPIMRSNRSRMLNSRQPRGSHTSIWCDVTLEVESASGGKSPVPGPAA